jgi:hypothetical protein
MTIVNNTYPGGIRFQTTTLVNEDIYTVLPTDYFILIGGSGTDLILNKQTIGQEYAIKNISTNSISISGSSCSIDGQSTCLLNSNESFWFLYDGNNYQKTLRDFNYIPISTINGLSGTNIELTPSSIGAQPSGSYLLSGTTTSLISEGTNKYYTDAKARAVISGTYPMAVTNGLIEIAQATTTANGYLTSTDWNTFNNKQTSITGAASTITTSNLSSSIAVITDANGKISGLSTVSSTELGYLDGVTSSIQTQLNAKQPSGNFVIKTGDTMSGDLIFSTGNSITINSATGNTVAIFNASKELFSSSVTSTELGYLDGVTSAIQTQLNNKQAVSIGAVTTVTGTNLSASVAVVSDVNGKISGLSTVSVTELGYLDGVTSAIQTQINGKQVSGNYLISGTTTTYIPEGTNQYYTDTKARAVVSGTTPITVSNGGISISQANTTTNGYLSSTDWNTFNTKQAVSIGAVTTITGTNLSASVAVVSDANGKISGLSTVSVTELNYLDGVTSNVQTQINSKQNTGNYLVSGTTTTSIIGEGSNLYFTNARAMAVVSGTSPIAVSNGLVSISKSNTSTNGYLSSTDWNTFNGKQNSGNYLISGVSTTYIPEGTNLYYTDTRVNSNSTITGHTTSINNLNTATGTLSTSISATNTSLINASGVLNTKIDTKQATITGAATTVTGTNLTASMALVSNSSGKIANHASVTATELGYLDGVTSAIQTQLNNKQISGSYLLSGTTTSLISEGTNLYYTDARVRTVISGTSPSISGSEPISVSNGLVSIASGSSTIDGFISSGDWNTFNNKQNSLGADNTTWSGGLTLRYSTDSAYVSLDSHGLGGKVNLLAGKNNVDSIELDGDNGSSHIHIASSANSFKIDVGSHTYTDGQFKINYSGVIAPNIYNEKIYTSGINFNTSGTALIGSNAIPASGIYTKTLNNQIVAVNVFNEVPTGLINNVNKTYTLLYTPVANSTQIYMNGARLCPSGLYTGVGDYTILGTTLSMSNAPVSGSVILADYVYQI